MRRIISKKIVNFITKRRNKSIQKFFNNYFKKIMSCANPKQGAVHGDKEQELLWMNKWSVFGEKPSSLAWNCFYPYMKGDINFVPNEIARMYIEPILTPEEYQPFYNDKNSFGLFLNESWLPKTIFRCMDGKLLNGQYESIQKDEFMSLFDDIDKVVVKPSKDMGGRGVDLFQRKGDTFVNKGGDVLSLSFLEKKYKRDYLIQECLKQSEYMSQFNPTSVNTVRIATYRDVKTGKIDVIGAVLRVGGKGSFVDNACSGGAFIAVDEDGRLGKFACYENGVKQSIYNDIDFENAEFIIPNWDDIKRFVCNVAVRMPHMSLFANDVAIDHNGDPRLIEVNTIQFSYWLYQFNGKAVFGKYTDELIEYCIKEKDKIRPTIIFKKR